MKNIIIKLKKFKIKIIKKIYNFIFKLNKIINNF
jgi:hypothetical protein